MPQFSYLGVLFVTVGDLCLGKAQGKLLPRNRSIYVTYMEIYEADSLTEVFK